MTKEVRFVLLLRILTRFDRAVRPRLALMEPNLFCDPRIRENSGEPRGSETRSQRSALRRGALYLCPVLQRTATFESEEGHRCPNPLARHRVIPGSC